jgi:hypothetical protein
MSVSADVLVASGCTRRCVLATRGAALEKTSFTRAELIAAGHGHLFDATACAHGAIADAFSVRVDHRQLMRILRKSRTLVAD